MLKAHVYASPAPMPEVAGLPSEVARLVARCLAKKPDERPSSTEVAEVLGEIAGLPPSTLLRTAALPTVTHPRTGGRRSRRAMAVAGASATLLALGGSWWALADRPAGPPAATAAATPVCSAGTCLTTPAPSGPAPQTSQQPSPRTGTAPPAQKPTAAVAAVGPRTRPGIAAAPVPKAEPASAGNAKPKAPKAPKPPKSKKK